MYIIGVYMGTIIICDNDHNTKELSDFAKSTTISQLQAERWCVSRYLNCEDQLEEPTQTASSNKYVQQSEGTETNSAMFNQDKQIGRKIQQGLKHNFRNVANKTQRMINSKAKYTARQSQAKG